MISPVSVCVCVCVYVLVAQSCLTLCNPVDCNPPGSSVHGILQARILECAAISLGLYIKWYSTNVSYFHDDDYLRTLTRMRVESTKHK